MDRGLVRRAEWVRIDVDTLLWTGQGIDDVDGRRLDRMETM